MKLLRRRRTDGVAAAPVGASPAPPEPEIHVGTTILPDEGAAGRINSAADVDPNIRRYGVLGGPGGAGGYGGAGTK